MVDPYWLRYTEVSGTTVNRRRDDITTFGVGVSAPATAYVNTLGGWDRIKSDMSPGEVERRIADWLSGGRKVDLVIDPPKAMDAEHQKTVTADIQESGHAE